MHPIAFAARKLPHLLLLVGALEVEGGHIGPARHLNLAKLDDVEPVGNLFPDRLVGAKRVPRLIDIAELHRLADLQASGIGTLLADDHAEEGRLAGPIRADDADDAA